MKYPFAGLKVLALVIFFMFAAGGARAATWMVTKTQDTDDGVCDADCSLREAISVSNTGDNVVFSSLFSTPQVITLSTAFPYNGGMVISRNVVIDGPGADLLTVNGVNHVVFDISSGSFVTLRGMTIGNGYGITNHGTTTVSECVITGNDRGITNDGFMTLDNSTVADDAGVLFPWAIDNEGELNLINSTVSNNGDGGIENRGTLVMVNSTISGNGNLGLINYSGTTFATLCTITNNGSGIEAVQGSVSLRGTIVAANNALPDIFTSIFPVTVASYGFNLIGNDGTGVFIGGLDQAGTAAAPINPLLDPLGDYGGMTQTHRLQAGSPAIDKGASFGENVDQRGFVRPFDKASYPNLPAGDGSDIGAYELQLAVAITGLIFDPNNRPIRYTRVLIRSATGEYRSTETDGFGMYHFDNIPINRTYQISPTHKLYNFIPKTVTVREEGIPNLNFTALP